MKPLLESAVLTREDTKIWLSINLPMRRKAPDPLPSIAYFEADRRDANLMLWRVEHVYYNEWERREDLRDTWITPQGWWHPL